MGPDLATVRNTIQVTGTTVPSLRGLDLSFRVITLDMQSQIAHYEQAAQKIMTSAQDVADAAARLRQALADAAGSGLVGIPDPGLVGMIENERKIR